MPERRLAELFDACVECFPKDRWGSFRDPVVSARSGGEGPPSGPGRRWFEATDGQESDEAFFDGYRLLSSAESAELAEDFDERREQSAFCWVRPEWIPIAEGPNGDWLMIDDTDGRVLEVFRDESVANVLAGSAATWLRELVDDFDRGALVWDADCGLKDPDELTSELEEQALEARHARRREIRRRRERSPSHFGLELKPSEPPSRVTWHGALVALEGFIQLWVFYELSRLVWKWLVGSG